MPHSTNPKNAPDTGLMCLALLARYHGFAADPQYLSHQYATPGAPFSTTDILLAARGIGLKARQIDSRWERLAKTPLPAIAQHKDGHYFILGKLDGDKALVQDPLEKRPLVLPREVFEQAWNGRLILCTRRAGLADLGGKFDFSWFFPAIIKYRKLLGEVLIASFFIQLFALLSQCQLPGYQSWQYRQPERRAHQ